MATLIKNGEPAENEREAFQVLASQLGDDWAIFTNLKSYTFEREIDAFLVGPRGAIAIELKYWRGAVIARAFEAWDAPEAKDPCDQADLAARKIKSFLEKVSPKFKGSLYIKSIVLLTNPNSSLKIEDRQLEDRVALLRDASALIDRALKGRDPLSVDMLRHIFDAFKTKIPPKLIAACNSRLSTTAVQQRIMEQPARPKAKPITDRQAATALSSQIGDRIKPKSVSPSARLRVTLFAVILTTVAAALAFFYWDIGSLGTNSFGPVNSTKASDYTVSQTANERSGPSVTSKIIRVLKTGDHLAVVGREVDDKGQAWLKIQDGGFLRDRLAKLNEQAVVIPKGNMPPAVQEIIDRTIKGNRDTIEMLGFAATGFVVVALAIRAGRFGMLVAISAMLLAGYLIYSGIAWLNKPISNWQARMAAYQASVKASAVPTLPPPATGTAPPLGWTQWYSLPSTPPLSFDVAGKVRMQCAHGSNLPADADAIDPPCVNVHWVRLQATTTAEEPFTLSFRTYGSAAPTPVLTQAQAQVQPVGEVPSQPAQSETPGPNPATAATPTLAIGVCMGCAPAFRPHSPRFVPNLGLDHHK